MFKLADEENRINKNVYELLKLDKEIIERYEEGVLVRFYGKEFKYEAYCEGFFPKYAPGEMNIEHIEDVEVFFY